MPDREAMQRGPAQSKRIRRKHREPHRLTVMEEYRRFREGVNQRPRSPQKAQDPA